MALRRAYYYCGRCGKGQHPWDEEVGLHTGRLTPGAERAVALAGVASNSFAEAATTLLPELSGLRVAETTVERNSEAAGERVGAVLAAGKVLGGPKSWSWHRDATGKRCAYISVDATGVRQQAKDGGKAEGRMPYVGMIYNPVPDLPETSPYAPGPKATMQARYLAGLYSLGELGELLRRQGGQVGMNQADCWIGLTDGGNGLESFVRSFFPRVEAVILDFWHAAEHLGELARAWHPSDEDAARELKGSWCHALKHEGGQTLVDHLRALPLPKDRSQLSAKFTEVLGYLENNLDRTDYPTYLRNGWHIGSGAVESACKTVVAQRLKLAGMRWRDYGTDNICHLRALYRSEATQWPAFWSRKTRELYKRSTN